MKTIYFTKQFTSGTLKGLCVPGKFYAETVDACAKRIYRGAKGKDILTHDKWVVVDCSFQNYQR